MRDQAYLAPGLLRKSRAVRRQNLLLLMLQKFLEIALHIGIPPGGRMFASRLLLANTAHLQSSFWHLS
jgi:hypothetical protein